MANVCDSFNRGALKIIAILPKLAQLRENFIIINSSSGEAKIARVRNPRNNVVVHVVK